MNKIRCGFLALPLLFYSVSILHGFDSLAQQPERNDDSIEVLLKVYGDAVEANRSNSEPDRTKLNTFRYEWRQRLLDAAKQDKNSLYRESALEEALGLSNSLGDYNTARNIAHELIDCHKNDIHWKLRWLYELGEIEWFDVKRNSNDTPAGNSKIETYYKDYIKEYKMLVSNNMLPSDQEFSEYVDVLSKLSRLQSRDQKGYLRAAKLLQDCRYQLASRSSVLGHSIEDIASEEMIDWILGGKISEAEKTLYALAKINNKREPQSFYVMRFINEAFKSDREGRISFLKSWLTKMPRDKGSVFLEIVLANAYVFTKHFDLAATLYKNILTNSADFLLEEDKLSVKSKRGGWYSGVLFGAGLCYFELGIFRESKAYLMQFKELYANDGNISRADAMLLTISNRGWDTNSSLNESRTGVQNLFIKRTLLLGSLSGVILFIGYMVFKKANNRSNRSKQP